MLNKQTLQTVFANNQDRYFRELAEFIAFKSLSAEDKYLEECQKCADWLENHLKSIGLACRQLKTSKQPVVYAEKITDPKAKTLLIYGHYDVQPAEKCPEWQTEPFELTFKGNEFFARGAGDNKGQTFYIIKALEELIKADQLKLNVKLLIEGQEESGSSVTIAALPHWKKELEADYLLACDTQMIAAGKPVIALGMRGVSAFNLKLSGANSDLHSGVFGGQVKNPATELTKLIASLFKQDGTIAVDSFYDDMQEITAEEEQVVTQYDFYKYAKDTIGVEARGTEAGIHPMISNSLRPTIELNGFHSGYSGEGSNSIIPATAKANLSCRNAAGQNPERLLKLIEKHLQERCPEELNLEFKIIEKGCSGIRISSDNDYIRLGAEISSEITGGDCQFYYEGATIPIIPELLTHSTENAIVTGFGLQGDNWHGFNERFSIDRFELGFLFSAALMQELAK